MNKPMFLYSYEPAPCGKDFRELWELVRYDEKDLIRSVFEEF